MNTRHVSPVSPVLPLPLAALCAALLAGCGDGATAPVGTPTGTITVHTVSSGSQPDPDGYRVRVDGEDATAAGIGANEAKVLPDVPAGEHTVELTGLAANCDAVGGNAQSVMVPDGGSVSVTFDIACVSTIVNRILFVSDRNAPGSTLDLFAMDPDGSALGRLPTPTLAAFGQVSPDGRKIAFTGGVGQIWTMNVDGTEATPVISGTGHYPSWSPDGSRITFSSPDDDMVFVEDIFIVNADGTQLRNLTGTVGIDERYPAWSPDGSRIAYRAPGADGKMDIWAIDVVSGDRQNLTDLPGDDSFPAWSPDGTRIAYSSNRIMPIDLDPPGDFEIHIMNADGSGDHRVTNNLVEDRTPSWSPDGTRFAITVEVPSGDTDIYVIDVNGGNRQRLTFDSVLSATYAGSWR